ncbi:MAG: hypothetical protein UX47_C0009G0012 [Candidatus Collierbacteria bacterium GW2011_GWA2_46_26]|uniref:Uncharacterized protein n=1 Tax=Candidatus Collierbacteria bacterium GW2011_GWA2_46_26 TaxID=1618381 RepID=A0A0G1SGV4_9BACT|nr:MAG: hypothetical protein UX47_C0009G0012 [Candidatus Collierbacteria bacterium GW2011_GWA2_46_26]
MADKLKTALPAWSVSTFAHGNGQHGVSLFVPDGAVHRVLASIGDTVQLTNRGCTESEVEQVIVAVTANTNLEIELVAPAAVL